jgi:hypothetical protein
LSDGRYDILIKPESRPRSLRKLRYFHGPVLLFIAEETGMIHQGMPTDEIAKAKYWLKEALKVKYKTFFPVTWSKDPFRQGKRLTKRDGMTEIDDENCGKFLSALALDFSIPDPDDKRALEFYDEMMARY